MDEQRLKLRNLVGCVWFGPIPIIYVSEPNLIKRILTSSSFNDKLDLYEIGAKHMGHGLITSNSMFIHLFVKYFRKCIGLSFC